MTNLKPIRSEQDHDAALARVDELMGATPGSAEGRELDVLADLIELYESKHMPMGYPSPVAAIEYRMEQLGLVPRDLIPFIGSRAKVSEVLAGKRELTLPMASALHENLGIPAESLLGPSATRLEDPWARVEWTRFPLKTMAARHWIPTVPNPSERAEGLVNVLVDAAGGREAAGSALFRRNDHLRVNARMDAYSLQAWCWRVLARANEHAPNADYERGTVTLDFLRQVAKLSWTPEGPKLAMEFLVEHGIALVVERHLPKTYLDGAALRLANGRPVIGLTLRYDRIDNFWFCLLHELAHVGRHIDQQQGGAFVDDLSLRTVPRSQEDPREEEADDWAAEALIPRSSWEASVARDQATPSAVLALASELRVHPAIIAGRIRYERQNYRLLPHFVGTGEVRRQFDSHLR